MDCPILDFKEGDTHYIKAINASSAIKIHICSIVDERMIVYKYWTNWCQDWTYKVDGIHSLSFKIFLNKEDNCDYKIWNASR